MVEILDPVRARTSPSPQSEILSVPAVGRIFGICPAAARRWELRFLNDGRADDFVDLRVGKFGAARVDVPPGAVLIWRLPAGITRTRQPRDSLTRAPAGTVRTTQPSRLVISQGTEPHIYRVDIQLTVAAAIGDTTNCAPVESHLTARTYFGQGSTPTAPTTVGPPTPVAGRTTTSTTTSP